MGVALGPVPAQPGHPARLGRRPSIAAHHRPALVEARPRLPGRHRHGDRGRGWPGRGPGAALLRLCGLAAPDRRRPARLPGARGVPVAPAPPGHPGRPAGRRAQPGRPPPGHRPGRGQAHSSARPPAGWTAAVKRAANVRDDHFGPVALGVQIDGDLGWTDKPRPGRRPPAHAGPLPADRRHLGHRQDHRHRTRSLPGRPRRPQVLPDRRQGHRPRLRRACPGRLPVGQPPRPRRALAGAAHGRLARQPRRHPQPAHGHARLDRALLQGRRQPPAPPGAERARARTAPSAPPAS